jgi:hypothetical protein
VPTPGEQAAERPADGHGAVEPAAVLAGDEPAGDGQPGASGAGDDQPDAGQPGAGQPDDGQPDDGHPEASQPCAGQPPSRRRNRSATTSLIAGILGVTGLGAVLGIGFGMFGLAHAGRLGGRVRCWVGIVLSLLWLGGLAYVVPHVIKAADPGCTAYKEKALPRYNTAIEDFNHKAAPARTAADLGSAIASLRAAVAESRTQQPRTALRELVGQLARARADAHSGQVPGSVMLALNHDATAADNACGTI